MANTELTYDWVADKVLFHIKNELKVAGSVFTGLSEEFHAHKRFKKGDEVRIELPNKHRTIAGPDITGLIPDINEQSTNVKVDQHVVVPFNFLLTDWTLSMEAFETKHIIPGAISIANEVDMCVVRNIKTFIIMSALQV